MRHISHPNRANEQRGKSMGSQPYFTPSCRTTTSCAKRDGRQSKGASGCCRPWSSMVSPGDLTCRRALGDIGQMSGMMAATNPLRRSRLVRPQEGAYLAHRQRDPLLRLLPREHAHLGLRSKHGAFHGDGVGMRGNVVGQDQYGRLAVAHEVASHSEDEVAGGVLGMLSSLEVKVLRST
jgi:hypothetical protein